jgi:Arc/MetJ family transcription regulator
MHQHVTIRDADALMRTTITIDADVEALLKKVMRERELSFKETVNSCLRAALNRLTGALSGNEVVGLPWAVCSRSSGCPRAGASSRRRCLPPRP